MLAPWKKSYDKPRQCIKKQRHHFIDKGPYSQKWKWKSLSHVQLFAMPWATYNTVHEILQARILEWVPFSRGSSQPRDWIQVSHIAGRFFTSWATREAHVCESLTIKKAKHWRIFAFVLWCWRRLLKVLWTARRSNQSILKEINP